MSRIIILLLVGQILNSCPVWAEDIRDVKPPVDLPVNPALLYFVLMAGVIGAAIFILKYLLKWTRQTKVSDVPPQSPWIVALQKLEALKKQNLPGLGSFKEYYTLLSDIVRRYMEDRFSIKAPEMTTQEFLWYLKKTGELTPQHKELLTDFLNSCDMVKFARYGPSSKEMEESFHSAKKLIEETRAVFDTVIHSKK